MRNKLFILLFAFVSCVPVMAQDLSVVVNSEAYDNARDNYDGLYLHIVWEPAATTPSLSSTYHLIEYTRSRPATFNTSSRLGFQESSGAATERYILADGTSILLARLEQSSSSAIDSINANLANFGLSTVQERQAAINALYNVYTPPNIELGKMVNIDFRPLLSLFLPWLQIVFLIAGSMVVIGIGFRVLEKMGIIPASSASSISDSDKKKMIERANLQAEMSDRRAFYKKLRSKGIQDVTTAYAADGSAVDSYDALMDWRKRGSAAYYEMR